MIGRSVRAASPGRETPRTVLDGWHNPGNECCVAGRPVALSFFMKIKVVIHDAEEGGFWAEVPGIPGCATQGDSFEELLQNLYDAVEGCLSVDVQMPPPAPGQRVFEIAV